MINIADKDKLYKTYDHQEKMDRGVYFTIDYNGLWYSHGGALAGPIKRDRLAGLFGGAGKGFMAGKGLFIDEDGQYWLKSPDGQYKVEVEDVPFLITRYEIHSAGTPEQEIDLYTNFDELVFLDAEHPLIVTKEPARGTDVFYVEIRNGLKARFSKSVFHDIVSKCVIEASQNSETKYILRSYSQDFEIMDLS